MDCKVIIASLVSFVALSGTFAAERVGDWYVNIPSSVLKSMSASERTCAERAIKQFNGASFKAASAEWARFQSEFLTTASEEASAWAQFFCALSFDKAKEKYKAVEMYSEALELFPDSSAACLCLYFRGRSYIQNGNIKKGCADYIEILDNPAMNKHPVAYAACNSLAWEFLVAGKYEQALEYWRMLKDMPASGNRAIWRAASENLNLVDGLTNPEGALAKIVSNEKRTFDERRKFLRDWRAVMWREANHPSTLAQAIFKNGKKSDDTKEARMKYKKRLTVAFSKAAEAVFKKCDGGEWELLMIQYESFLQISPSGIPKIIEKAVSLLRAEKVEDRRSSMASEFVKRLTQSRRFAEAKLIAENVSNPVKRAWLHVDIGWEMRDGKYIAENLDVLEKSPDADIVRKAKLNRAACCRHILKDYDTAIKIWNEYPDPPGTLWQIAECQRLAGRKAVAQGVLDEICGVFPSDAASAMLRKGDWYAADGDKKNAIGCYRRVLSHAEWKKTSASSQAHQRLERYGIATGGAVLNEIH